MSGVPAPSPADPTPYPEPGPDPIPPGEAYPARSCECLPLIPPPPVPDCVVQFDYHRWAIRFPEFDEYLHPGTPGVVTPPGWIPPPDDNLFPNPMGVSPELAQELFYDATLFLDNSCHSPVCDASKGGERERLLFLLTAHLAYLRGTPGIGGAGGAGNPGHLTSKSVGPVSVGYSLDGVTGNEAWFAQTSYGFTYWQATAQYRTFRYRAGPWFRGYGWRSSAWQGAGNPLPFAQSVAR
jgi:hypothetical protein